MKTFYAAFITFMGFVSACAFSEDTKVPASSSQNRVILFIWDGLRPDSVTLENTPHLYRFMKNGVQFLDNHSSYPTFTMINASSFATGARAGLTGFYGNKIWDTEVQGNDAEGKVVDFKQPVHTEDYTVLQALSEHTLLFTNTLFHLAHQKGMTTAAVGKSGAAFLQDYLQEGYILDEKIAYPLSFAKELQQSGYALPNSTPLAYETGKLVLAEFNGTPTASKPIDVLIDGVTPDASSQDGSPYNQSNEYLMQIYLNELLTKKTPQLSVIWMRNPDSTEHQYGPGTANHIDALKHNDKLLGMLLARLEENKMIAGTDIIIVSDHGHSSVSGPVELFPLRAIQDKQIGASDDKGYSVSGEIRTAHLLTKAGFKAFDGLGCVYNPVLSGVKANGEAIYPTQVDETGKICGEVGKKYTTQSYKLPDPLPIDAIVLAANGGTINIYVPSHNAHLINKLVSFFASHKEFGALFVDNLRYGNMPGTLPLSMIGLQNRQGRTPDLIIGLNYDDKAKIQNVPGTEFSDYYNMRGMHGSFSPIDTHNFMAAKGPHFRSSIIDVLPTGNVDVAPTIAKILGIELPPTEGRVLSEVLTIGKPDNFTFYNVEYPSENPLTNLSIQNAVGEKTGENAFRTVIFAKVVVTGDKGFVYFDKAEGQRK